MVSRDIARDSMLHAVPHGAIRRSGEPVMQKPTVVEALSRPAESVSLHLVDRIPARSPPQAPDGLPTRPSVDFRRPSYMEAGIWLDLHFPVHVVTDDTAADP